MFLFGFAFIFIIGLIGWLWLDATLIDNPLFVIPGSLISTTFDCIMQVAAPFEEKIWLSNFG
jgi:hypothetical protein